MREACKVLIVDDEMLIRQGIINYINWEQEGFRIVGEASNGKEALELIEEFSPHIVITDIVMPIMDGIDLAREAKKAFPMIEIIVLSSFENFDYVRSTFQSGVADYILKPKLNGEELLRSLNGAASRIPGFQHSASPVEPTRSTEEMLESVLLGYDFVLDKEVLAGVFTNSRSILVAACGEVTDPAKVKQLFEQPVFESMPVFSIGSKKSAALFLLNFKPHQLEAIKQEITQQAADHPEIKWVVSEPFETVEDMKLVYDEGSAKMKKYLFYLPDRSLFFYDALPQENEKQDNFDLNHFIEMFKDRLFEPAFTYLEHHIEYLAGRYNNDSFEFKSFLGNIIFNIIVLLDTMKFDTENLEQKKYSYFSNINEADHINEALEQFNKFLGETELILRLGGESAGESTNLDKILAYIEQHYTQPLRLSEIASHFHFNASYLSSYFSTHHKEGFSEYLNRVRIKKSMELLRNSSVSISNISGMVGYSEHSYFCKVFKRITGMSPGSYRKEHQIRHENEEKGLSHLKK